jgi:hypothetical protein
VESSALVPSITNTEDRRILNSSSCYSDEVDMVAREIVLAIDRS